jgi:hypothetical protein
MLTWRPSWSQTILTSNHPNLKSMLTRHPSWPQTILSLSPWWPQQVHADLQFLLTSSARCPPPTPSSSEIRVYHTRIPPPRTNYGCGSYRNEKRWKTIRPNIIIIPPSGKSSSSATWCVWWGEGGGTGQSLSFHFPFKAVKILDLKDCVWVK